MKKGEETEVEITHWDEKGRGRGSSVEVIGAVPRDVVRVRPWKKTRGRWRADLLEVVSSSPDRVPVRCAHAPACGGCTWQQASYAAQLQEKERRLKEVFASLLEPNPSVLRPILPCLDPWEYRNKMEFSFSQNKAQEQFLGLVLAGSRGHVFNLSECHLVSPQFTRIVGAVRQWWEASGLQAYRHNDTGHLRTLTVREGKRTGDLLVMLTVSGNPAFALRRAQIEGFVAAVRAVVPAAERLSVFLRVQQLQKGAPTQFFEMHLFGPDHLRETLRLPSGELHFKVSPTSFFQPNTLQAERLYAEAVRCVSERKKHVLDLYAGTATLGMAFASRAERVTAIELNPYACFDAAVNKELNGINHLEIRCGDVADELGKVGGKPDLVIVDPPRAGLSPQALSCVQGLGAEELLYISCNPKTQADNLRALIAAGYRLELLQPVDQFPHTVHLETIALLRKG